MNFSSEKRMQTPIHLESVTAANWQAVIALRVREDQRNFVASNLFSLAESRFYPELVPMGIYAGDELAGFLMYGLDPETSRYWLVRLMIDERFQGKGYAREAMRQVLDVMAALPGCDRVYLSYEPENHHAARLYAALGFEPTGEVEDGELVVCRPYSQKGNQ